MGVKRYKVKQEIIRLQGTSSRRPYSLFILPHAVIPKSEILTLMFLTNFVLVPTNIALFIILISLMIIEFGTRKYYTHVL